MAVWCSFAGGSEGVIPDDLAGQNHWCCDFVLNKIVAKELCKSSELCMWRNAVDVAYRGHKRSLQVSDL